MISFRRFGATCVAVLALGGMLHPGWSDDATPMTPRTDDTHPPVAEPNPRAADFAQRVVLSLLEVNGTPSSSFLAALVPHRGEDQSLSDLDVLIGIPLLVDALGSQLVIGHRHRLEGGGDEYIPAALILYRDDVPVTVYRGPVVPVARHVSLLLRDRPTVSRSPLPASPGSDSTDHTVALWHDLDGAMLRRLVMQGVVLMPHQFLSVPHAETVDE